MVMLGSAFRFHSCGPPAPAVSEVALLGRCPMTLFNYVLQHFAKRMAILIPLLAASPLVARAQVTWSSPVNVSQAVSGFSGDPQIAVDSSGNINVVWAGYYLPGIFFTRSTDGGTSFSAPVDVSNGQRGTAPSIALDPAGSINIAWQGFLAYYFCGSSSVPLTNYGLFFTRTTDGGATFSAPQDVSTTSSDGIFGYRIAVDLKSQIDVAWNSYSF